MGVEVKTIVRASLPLACVAIGELLLSGCIPVPPSAESARNHELTLPFNNMCLPFEVLSDPDRSLLRRHSRLIDRVLDEEFSPNINLRINRYQLDARLDVVRGDQFDPRTHPSTFDDCLALLQSSISPDTNMSQFRYRFPNIQFGLIDPWLRDVYGRRFSGDIVVEINHKRGAFDRFGEPVLASYTVDLAPESILKSIAQEDLDMILQRWLRVLKSGVKVEEEVFDATYSAGTIQILDKELFRESHPKRKSLKYTESDRKRTLLVDQVGRVTVHTQLTTRQ